MSQLSRKINDEITGNQHSRVRRTSGRDEAGPKGKVEQERMQVCLTSICVGAYDYGKYNGGVSSVDRPVRSTATTP